MPVFRHFRLCFLHINHLIEITHSQQLLMTIGGFKVFIGVHSVCQPLCYFRMTEFRRLACCLPRMPWNRSRSFSQLNRSYANTRSVIRDEDLLEPPESPLNSEPLLVKERISPALEISLSDAWPRKKSTSFRTISNGTQEQKKAVANNVQLEMDAISYGSKLSDL
ncbi:hypothetical protein OSTOST_03872 [Ostertagia ostertagi]